ncbi:PTS sugar transporter subunit IIA [Breznakia pachnodae]|uniref:Fructose-specific phosphotransferase system IIA component n=1 Tax=Breznakia pachnodae TaxID=265178 RepID=A0ABU0E082_9FIRM|nr:PTS sugar transporter subunit IIA [Breznakia pachnodae]MDQ0360297.1 fructose-specific phosphotransferase system IIA component [Breznakia pachnodae]
MNINELIDERLIDLHVKGKTKEAILKSLCIPLLNVDAISDADGCYQDIMKRESEVSTGFIKGIAIPHTQSKHVKRTSISIAKCEEKIFWETLDDEPVQLIFLICVPLHESGTHLKILAKIAEMLTEEEICVELTQANTTEELLTIIRREIQ